MAELKPCPFCGGVAGFIAKAPDTTENKAGYKFVIACTLCGATIPSTEGFAYFHLNFDGSATITSDCLNRAAKQWNRRAEDGKDNKTAI